MKKVGIPRILGSMRFRILHMLLLVALAAFALAMRSIASNVGNDGLISLSTIGISILTSTGLCCLGAKTKHSIIGGLVASTLFLSAHYIECLFKTPATQYVWRNPYFSSDPEIYVLAAIIVLMGCLFTASVSTFLTKLVIGKSPR